jgi:hypothetical protein
VGRRAHSARCSDRRRSWLSWAAPGLVHAPRGDGVDGQAAADAEERGGEAAPDLPAASRLTDALGEFCWGAPSIDIDALPDDDLIEDSLQITRVQPGRIWLGEVGPLALPKRATNGVQVGWEVWVVAARVGGREAVRPSVCEVEALCELV